MQFHHYMFSVYSSSLEYHRQSLCIMTVTHLEVRQAEFDLPVQTTRSHEGRVQGVRSVGGHQHFDVATWVKAIQLVDELQHCSLNLVVSASTVVKTSTWLFQKLQKKYILTLYHI